MRTIHGNRIAPRGRRAEGSRARRLLGGAALLLMVAAVALLVRRGLASGGTRVAEVASSFTFGDRVVTSTQLDAFLASRLGFTSRGGEMRCSHATLGQEPAAGQPTLPDRAPVRIYVEVLCLEHVRDGDSLATGSGRALPVAVSGVTDGDSVRLLAVTVPADGATNAADLRRIFPHAIAQRLLRPSPSAIEPRRAMERLLREQAATRLGVASDPLPSRR